MTYKYKSSVCAVGVPNPPSIEVTPYGKYADCVLIHWSHEYKDLGLSPADARNFGLDLIEAAKNADRVAADILAKKKAVAEAEALKLQPKTEIQILREALQKISTDTYCFPRQAAKEALKAADDTERTPYMAYAYLPNSRYLSSFVD